jgi:hypothetical protein
MENRFSEEVQKELLEAVPLRNWHSLQLIKKYPDSYGT